MKWFRKKSKIAPRFFGISHLGLKNSILLILILSAAALLVNGLISFMALQKDQQSFGQIVDTSYPKYDRMRNVQILFDQSQSALFQHMASANTSWMSLIEKSQDSLLGTLDQNLKSKIFLNESFSRAEAKQVLDLWAQYRETYQRVRNFSQSGDKNDAQLFYLNDEMTVIQPFDSIIVAKTEKARLEFQKIRKDAEQSQNANRTLMIGCGSVMIALILMLGWYLTRSILNQVGGEPRKIAQIAQRIAHGDLRIESTKQKVVPGSILESVLNISQSLLQQVGGEPRQIAALAHQIAQGNLKEPELIADVPRESILHSVLTIADFLRQTMTELGGLAQTLNEYANQLGQASEYLEDVNLTSSRNIDRVSSAIEQINSMLSLTVSKTHHTKGVIDQVSHRAQDGNVIIQQSHESLKNIGASAVAIGLLSHQSKMLALNAAIEAARVGAAGSGFAVVALEVRKLADRSDLAAKDINQLRAENEHKSHEAAEVFDGMMAQFENLIQAADEIYEGTKEQSLGLNEINLSVQEICLSLNRQTEASQGLSHTAMALQDSALKLNQHLSVFEIK